MKEPNPNQGTEAASAIPSKPEIIQAGPLRLMGRPRQGLVLGAYLGDQEILSSSGWFPALHPGAEVFSLSLLEAVSESKSFIWKYQVASPKFSDDPRGSFIIQGTESGQLEVTWDFTPFESQKWGGQVLPFSLSMDAAFWAGKSCFLGDSTEGGRQVQFPAEYGQKRIWEGVKSVRFSPAIGVEMEITTGTDDLCLQWEDGRGRWSSLFTVRVGSLNPKDSMALSGRMVLQFIGSPRKILPIHYGRMPQLSIATTPVLPRPRLLGNEADWDGTRTSEKVSWDGVLLDRLQAWESGSRGLSGKRILEVNFVKDLEFWLKGGLIPDGAISGEPVQFIFKATGEEWSDSRNRDVLKETFLSRPEVKAGVPWGCIEGESWSSEIIQAMDQLGLTIALQIPDKAIGTHAEASLWSIEALRSAMQTIHHLTGKYGMIYWNLGAALSQAAQCHVLLPMTIAFLSRLMKDQHLSCLGIRVVGSAIQDQASEASEAKPLHAALHELIRRFSSHSRFFSTPSTHPHFVEALTGVGDRDAKEIMLGNLTGEVLELKIKMGVGSAEIEHWNFNFSPETQSVWDPVSNKEVQESAGGKVGVTLGPWGVSWVRLKGR